MVLYDKDIREPLFDFLELSYGKIRIIEEKAIGTSRADVVMVTPDALYGIEIKSDADSYARLASQVKDYDKYCDYNFVVVGTTHAHHIKEHVPEHWGIITVEAEENEPDFYVLRRPSHNPHVTWEKKLCILWRPELSRLQQLHDMPKYKEKSKQFVIEKIVGRIPERIAETDLRTQVSELLFERDYTTIEETLTEYRKSETQKKLDVETDSAKRLAIMTEAAAKSLPLKKRRRKRRR